MGLFNTLHVTTRCLSCTAWVPLHIQFKYGDLYGQLYRIGDTLVWCGWPCEECEEGRQVAGTVLVQGPAERCPECGEDDLRFRITIHADVIVNASPISDDHPWPGGDAGIVYVGDHGNV